MVTGTLVLLTGHAGHAECDVTAAIDPEARVRFPALPDFLRSSVSGTGSTQPHEYN
jgi:hypothetical protein